LLLDEECNSRRAVHPLITVKEKEEAMSIRISSVQRDRQEEEKEKKETKKESLILTSL